MGEHVVNSAALIALPAKSSLPSTGARTVLFSMPALHSLDAVHSEPTNSPMEKRYYFPIQTTQNVEIIAPRRLTYGEIMLFSNTDCGRKSGVQRSTGATSKGRESQ